MNSLPEQLSAARKAQFDAQFDLFRTLSNQAFERASLLISLNLHASRDSVERSSRVIRQFITASGPQDLLALGGSTEEQFRSMFSYSRELFSIAAGGRPQLAEQATPSAATDVDLDARATAVKVEAAAGRVSEQAPQAGTPAPAAPKAEAPAEAETKPAGATKQAQPPADVPQDSGRVAATPQELAAEAEKASRKAVAAGDPAPQPSPAGKAKPIAKAAHKLAKGGLQHPVTAPVPAGEPIVVPQVKPVDAEPPPPPVSGTPEIDVRQHEIEGIKPQRKK